MVAAGEDGLGVDSRCQELLVKRSNRALHLAAGEDDSAVPRRVNNFRNFHRDTSGAVAIIPDMTDTPAPESAPPVVPHPFAELRFRAFGTPKPQRRPQAFYNEKTGKAGTYNLKNAEPWKWEIGHVAEPAIASAIGATPLAGPLEIEMTFWFARPKGHYGTGRNAKLVKESSPRFPCCKGKEDFDNIAKPVCDVLTVLRAWDDDGLIVRAVIAKLYETETERPGCLVVVRRVL
jgi:Holliday junction resolvase RusA-like endonuclease